VYSETQVESKNNCARDRGEERASFQNKDREKILMRKRRRGRQSLFLRHRWRERKTVQETEGKKELHFKTEVGRKFLKVYKHEIILKFFLT